MNLNQSACDGIADFALAESGASYGSFRKNCNFLTCHFKFSFFVFIIFAEEQFLFIRAVSNKFLNPLTLASI